MISWLVAEVGMRGPRIWPDAPTEAAAKTTDAATAPWRNLRRETRGPLAGGGCVATGCVERRGGVVVDVLGFFSSMDMSPLLKNNFCSVHLHAIKDLSISYADDRLDTTLRKQYNYA